MSEKVLLEQADEIGPEAMVYVYDPETGMKGLVVIDSTACGFPVGGTRMLPDITVDEMRGLARAMTYKNAILSYPRGGSKCGIWGDPDMPKEKKVAILKAFGRALAPYLKTGHLFLGSDMGVKGADVAAIHEGAGLETYKAGVSDPYAVKIDGEPLGNHAAGYGVVVGMKTACELAGVKMAGATVAIEGFGEVGGGVLRYAAKEGAKIVALSTRHEAIYNKDGLDPQRLFELRKQFGDRCLKEYKDAKRIPNNEIYFQPVDVLVPGARPWVINKANVNKVKAKVIAEAANIPVTEEAEEILFRKGIVTVPDFIANCGAIVMFPVFRMGGTVEQAFKGVSNAITMLTREVIEEGRRTNTNPYAVAVSKCKEKVLKARGQPKKTYEEALPEMKKLLGVF